MTFNDFDDLFSDFYKNYGNKEFEKLMESLINLKKDNETSLGDPTSVENFEQDGYTFKKTTWKTEEGLVTKIEMVGAPFDQIKKPIVKERLYEIPLEIQLASAIEEERYEDAVIIRDEIKRNDKTSLKDFIDKQEIDEKNEWNF